jgi:hypothetical protein
MGGGDGTESERGDEADAGGVSVGTEGDGEATGGGRERDGESGEGRCEERKRWGVEGGGGDMFEQRDPAGRRDKNQAVEREEKASKGE